MVNEKLIGNLLNMATAQHDLKWEPYSADSRRNVEIVRLYDARDNAGHGPAAALLRYSPGARVARHRHLGYELIFVLEGVLHNDTGAHPAGTLEVCPPDSVHELWSDEGCVFLVVWEQPVRVESLIPIAA